jgi:hypothetical protein
VEKEACPARHVQFELEEKSAERGPEGTAPIPRNDWDKIVIPKSLKDTCRKPGTRANALRAQLMD